MSRLILIEQSLADASGHHLDYLVAVCKAAVADSRWQQIVVGTHREFDPALLLGKLVTSGSSRESNERVIVLPAFRQDTYQPWTSLYGLRRLTRSRTRLAAFDRFLETLSDRGCNSRFRLWQKLSRWLGSGGGRGLGGKFQLLQQDWIDFLSRCQPRSGDRVFAVTVSDLEWLALASIMDKCPELAAEADWHVQFHFDLFQSPELDRQSPAGQPSADTRVSVPGPAALDSLDSGTEPSSTSRLLFALAGRLSHNHRVHFHTTSAPLAAQYEKLQVGSFQALTYPLNPLLEVSCERPTDIERERFRVTLAGGTRREKGESSALANACAELAGQTWARQLEMRIQGKAGTDRRLQTFSFIRPVKHPLPEQEYVELIRSSHVGVLMYDRNAYRNRRAGILGEYLACGIPVVVTSGCWLAEQFAHHQQQHARHLFEQNEIETVSPMDEYAARLARGTTFVARVDWRRASHQPRFFRLSCPAGSQPLDHSQGAGALSRLHAVGRQNPISHVVGQFDNLDAPESLQVVAADSGEIVRGVEIQIRRLQLGKQQPVSAVGLCVDHAGQLPWALSEIRSNYEHYRRTAIEFASEWREQHRPENTLLDLEMRVVQNLPRAG